MRKTILLLALATLMAFSLTPAMAYTTIDFYKLTNNNVENLFGQLFADLYLSGESAPNPAGGTVAIGANQAGFYFRNTGPIASNITEIYFDDGAIVSGPGIYANGTSVQWELKANPGDLPGGNTAVPPFVATVAFNSQASGNNATGVGVGENLLLTFATTGNILTSLANGDLRIGMHIRSIGTRDGSDSYVNNPVPIPGAVLLLGAGMARLVAYARRRKE